MQQLLLFVKYFLLVITPPSALSLHLKGSWNTSKGFVLLARFGIQKTIMDDTFNSRGYIYGNFTSAEDDDEKGINTQSTSPRPALGTLVVVDSDYFFDIYSAAKAELSRDKEWAERFLCQNMLQPLHTAAWDGHCNTQGKMDLLRSIPCPKHKLCAEEDDPKNVIDNYQFTFSIQDTIQARYWYVMLMSCTRNASSCLWHNSRRNAVIHYDIWLVNGSPQMLARNRFEHQFSFEYHDTFELYVLFLIAYLITTLFYQLRFHVSDCFVSLVLLSHLWIMSGSLCALLLHQFVLAFDGVGVHWLWRVGQWARHSLADPLLLCLLVFATQCRFNIKSSSDSSARVGQIALLTVFVVIASVLYIWCEVDKDAILDFDVWESVPGTLWLALRYCVSLYFFYAILNLHSRCISPVLMGPNKSLPPISVGLIEPSDYIHMAAGFSVWALALPISVIVAELIIQPLWRLKTIYSITLTADFLAIASFIYIVWKTKKSEQRSAFSLISHKH